MDENVNSSADEHSGGYSPHKENFQGSSRSPLSPRSIQSQTDSIDLTIDGVN